MPKYFDEKNGLKLYNAMTGICDFLMITSV